MEKVIEKKKPLVHIPHWRDDQEILDRIDSMQEKNKNPKGKKAPYADVMRKVVRDGLEANE